MQTPNEVITNLKLADIDPDPDQPREKFSKIEELANSMAEVGLLQPILVVLDQETNRYRVVFGETRRRAAIGLEWETIPCVVMSDGTKAIEAQTDENLLRSDLDPFEEAKAFRRLKQAGWISEKIGKRFGRHRSDVESTLSLQRIPASLQNEIGCRNSDTKPARGALYRIAALPEEQMHDAWRAYCDKGTLAAIPRAKARRKNIPTERTSAETTFQSGHRRVFTVSGGIVEVTSPDEITQEIIVRMLQQATERAAGRNKPVEVAMPADHKGG